MSIHPTQYGTQNATVVLKKKWVNDLCKKGTIRIGWTLCRIRERVNIIRCYRCLEFGHNKSECQGEDKREMCLKCGKTDHCAKNCTEKSLCITCKRKGHRADQTRCLNIRKLIQESLKEIVNGKRGRKASASVIPSNVPMQ